MNREHPTIFGSSRPHGMAPLELVLSMPFVLGLSAMMLSLGWLALGRYHTSIEARHLAWKMRGEPNSKPDGVIESTYKPAKALFFLSFNDLAGEIYVKTQTDIKLFPWLGGIVHPQSETAVLTDSWDHASVPEFDKTAPHIGVLGRMVGADFLGPVQDLFGLINLSSITTSQDYKDAEKDRDAAKEEVEKQRKKVEEEIKRLRKEYEKLEQERDALEIEQSKLEEERNRLDDEISELEKQKPRPPELDDKIRRRDELNGKIDDLQQQIDAKERQMVEKQREIKEMEDALERADQETGKLPS